MITQELIERIKLDIARIREPQSRTESISSKPLRWEGLPNPNGWRLMGNLADDLEFIIEHLESTIDNGR